MIKAHANEYMVNAKSMRDPYVMNTVQAIETAKSKGTSPSAEVANTNTTGIDTAAMVAAADRMNAAAERLHSILDKGIVANMLYDDEAHYKLRTEMERFDRRDKIISK